VRLTTRVDERVYPCRRGWGHAQRIYRLRHSLLHGNGWRDSVKGARRCAVRIWRCTQSEMWPRAMHGMFSHEARWFGARKGLVWSGTVPSQLISFRSRIAFPKRALMRRRVDRVSREVHDRVISSRLCHRHFMRSGKCLTQISSFRTRCCLILSLVDLVCFHFYDSPLRLFALRYMYDILFLKFVSRNISRD